MRIAGLGAGSALLFSLLSAGSASAQRVSADIRIGGGPISGQIRIGDRGDFRRDGRARRVRVDILRRDDRRFRDGRFRDWQRGSRVVVVYYDYRDDCYYDDYYPGLQEIRVYERDGRFYRFDDDRYDGYNRGNDPYGRYDRNDRRDDRYDGRNDNGQYGRSNDNGRYGRPNNNGQYGRPNNNGSNRPDGRDGRDNRDRKDGHGN